MKRRNLILLAASAALLCTAGDHQPRRADAGVVAAAGQILNIDPATGKIVDTPTQSIRALQDAMAAELSTSGDGLVVEKSPVKGGGVMINLQGRFQNASTAVIDANGTLQAPCITGSSADAKDASDKGPVK